MTLTYKKCPLCEDGDIAYLNDEAQLEGNHLAMLHRVKVAMGIIANVLEGTGVTLAQVRSDDRTTKVTQARQQVMLVLNETLGLGPSAIATLIHRAPSTISQYLTAHRRDRLEPLEPVQAKLL